ncbi:MAG: universal stress protein [Thermodesulfobacteriota bacterium]
MKIMYCHDGTESAQQSLERAVGFFKARKPDMILVCVAEDVLDASLVDETITEEYQSEQSGVMRRAAEWVAAQGLDVDVLLATGDPRKMILGAIEKKSPDIVIVARKEKSAMEGVFRKSLSAYLVKNAGCHLFIMGPS